MITNTTKAYGSLAKFFHWVVGVLIIAMLAFGFFMGDFSKSVQPLIYNVHKLTGLTILFLMLLRLCWRMLNTKPVPAQDVPYWQRWAERFVHHFLYFFAIAMPIAGWVGSAAAGRNPHLGSYSFVLPIEKSETVSDVAFWFHNNIAWVLIALVSVHVLAALYHYFIKRDDIMQRML